MRGLPGVQVPGEQCQPVAAGSGNSCIDASVQQACSSKHSGSAVGLGCCKCCGGTAISARMNGSDVSDLPSCQVYPSNYAGVQCCSSPQNETSCCCYTP